ncbi:MAG: hypothetical protein Q7W30_11000 [Coriobacteriia bacterium]|nr:hypothetical protein [Coriobacteriia bacterium]
MNAILPPLVIDVRVRTRESKGFRIWFPFFLLWPLLLVLVGFCLLITVLVDLALLIVGARYHHYTPMLLQAMRVLAQSRGTRAHVDSAETHVNLDIY